MRYTQITTSTGVECVREDYDDVNAILNDDFARGIMASEFTEVDSGLRVKIFHQALCSITEVEEEDDDE